jgi:dienelactone hydrolase
VTAGDLKAGIDWAERENSRVGSPLYGKVQTHKIAIMGQSCGGSLAITLGADPRVGTIGVFNSGIHQSGSNEPFSLILPNAPPLAALNSLHGSVLLLNGGDPDFMKGASRATYEAIEKLPAFYGSRHDVGHAATMFYPGGGEFANVASSWARWQLKQDTTAGAMFVGSKCGLCVSPVWDVESKRLTQ